MKSPFAIFRRYEKTLMVLLTGMAMFAFLFLDSITRSTGHLPLLIAILLIGGLCAGAMWIIGAPRERGTEFALAGAVVGGVIAYLFVNMGGPPPAAITSVKSFSSQELQRMVQRRALANRFMNEALMETNSSFRQEFRFGSPTDRDVVYAYLLRREAADMGIQISDEAVTNFIREMTQDKLTTDKYRGILRRMGISESDLYSMLREELQTRLAADLLSPPRSPQGVGGLMTPEQMWDDFQKLHLQAEATVAAVPAEAFLDKVADPSEAELQAFFEQFKQQVRGADGTPGFLQPRRVNLAYLAAGFEDFEKQAGEITDEEVRSYYDSHKELYRIDLLPDQPAATPKDETQPLTPEFSPEPDSKQPASKEFEAKQPEAKQTPAENPKPAAPEKSERKSDEQGSAQFNVQDNPGAAAETASAPTNDEPADALHPANQPTGTAPATPAPPKYRELDTELKAEIRERLRADKAFQLMGDATQAAQERMLELGSRYAEIVGTDEKAQSERAAAAEGIAQDLKDYAKQHNLSYEETGLVSDEDLRQTDFGTAVEPGANPMDQSGGRSVTQEAFGTEMLYFPRRADDIFRNQRYAWWKIADMEAHVPTLQEAGVREQVVHAWKMMKATSLAEARAKELAEQVRKSDQPMAATLNGTTITGAEGGQPLQPTETPRFSWLSTPRTPMANPLGFQPPELSAVPGIDNPGPKFMEMVFHELDKGEVGVAPNLDKSTYYVVQVNDRVLDTPTGPATTSGKDEKERFMNERFFGVLPFFLTPYDFLSERSVEQVRSVWQQRLQEKYDIQWHRNPDRQGG